MCLCSCPVLNQNSSPWPTVAAILRCQLAFLLTGLGPNEYTELHKVLMND